MTCVVDSDPVVESGPLVHFGRRGRRQFRARSVAPGGLIVGRRALRLTDGMGEARRSEPVRRRTKRADAAASGAVERRAALALVKQHGTRVVAHAALSVEAPPLPRVEAVVSHW